MDHLGFGLLLFAALVLSVAFSYLQHRSYMLAVRAVAADHDRPGVVVVSGRGKGFLRGTIAILAVDATTRRVLEARTMTGSTVLARFRRRPDLEGSLRGIEDRAGDKRTREALSQALVQFRETTRHKAAAYRSSRGAASPALSKGHSA
ncbi:MAG: transcriptional regulator GutM [Brachybacterium sp.]|nr:transcriptional regulator GutM [Brachybacterium sp.]